MKTRWYSIESQWIKILKEKENSSTAGVEGISPHALQGLKIWIQKQQTLKSKENMNEGCCGAGCRVLG